jgi:ssDNA-binding Zn-finger/Zn-ribbon topoisomerase 1
MKDDKKLEEEKRLEEEHKKKYGNNVCPLCGGALAKRNGCQICISCGYEKCDI